MLAPREGPRMRLRGMVALEPSTASPAWRGLAMNKAGRVLGFSAAQQAAVEVGK